MKLTKPALATYGRELCSLSGCSAEAKRVTSQAEGLARQRDRHGGRDRRSRVPAGPVQRGAARAAPRLSVTRCMHLAVGAGQAPPESWRQQRHLRGAAAPHHAIPPRRHSYGDTRRERGPRPRRGRGCRRLGAGAAWAPAWRGWAPHHALPASGKLRRCPRGGGPEAGEVVVVGGPARGAAAQLGPAEQPLAADGRALARSGARPRLKRVLDPPHGGGRGNCGSLGF